LSGIRVRPGTGSRPESGWKSRGPGGRADLHVHTSASDGLLSPAEVVETAAASGLAAVGITDHDTVAGIDPALERAAELGRDAPVVVPAVEINTDWGEGEIHVLGYLIEWRDPDLARILQGLRKGRLRRVERIAEKLTDLGLEVSVDRIISLCEEGSVGRPHVARALVEAGYVDSVRDAFENYLARGRPAYVARDRFSPTRAVRTIRQADGVAVLAHPAGDATGELIDELVKAGLEGIEVYHPDHGLTEERFYLALAAEKGLMVTGGSDSHGPGHAHGAAIGFRTVEFGAVDELRRRKERRRRV